MFTARQIVSLQPLLLLAVLALTTCAIERGACLAQGSSASSQRGQPRSRQTEQLVAEGVAAFERGDAAAARASFDKALRLDPDDVSAHTYLGIMADGAGDLKEAERHFSAAALADPFRASARNNYGAILLRTGRPQLAAAQFEASLKLDRRQPSALVNLAQIRFAAGTPAELGAALFEAGLLKEAEEELTAAVNLNHADTESSVRLARVHLARRDVRAAGPPPEKSVARGHDPAPGYALLPQVYE